MMFYVQSLVQLSLLQGLVSIQIYLYQCKSSRFLVEDHIQPYY